MAVAKLAVSGQADPWTENERETMRKLITRSVLATAVVLVMASSASAALIPIGQWEFFDGTFSIINQTGPDTTDDFPVTDLLTFNTINTNFGNTLADFAVSLNVLFSSGWSIPSATTRDLSGTVIPTGLVSLSSGTNALWNGQWNIISGILVGANGLSPVSLALDENSFLETALIYVEAEAVPEPMTVGLLATGMAGLLLRRRKAAGR